MAAKIGVLLSGCGVFDGSEIYESVITLLELDKSGAEVTCMAPDIDQLKVVNHLSSSDSQETRNVLVESARVARGEISNVNEVDVDSLDALILPGGFGAALNNCNFAVAGPDGEVNAGVASVVQKFFDAKKPIGAMCIAPTLLALVLKGKGIKLTIGSDEGVAAGINATGNIHVNSSTADIVVDEYHKVVTTPAYMTAGSISEAAIGIEKLVKKILELA
ncbi:MAG: isoprenoid biosynthesis glyoxalase ElbB [Lentisphaeraceae bacterium]|nr:isoprenoid biosynthesis glyoxalase ElbB [Lentisphaeraceae bacterium]